MEKEVEIVEREFLGGVCVVFSRMKVYNGRYTSPLIYYTFQQPSREILVFLLYKENVGRSKCYLFHIEYHIYKEHLLSLNRSLSLIKSDT